MSDGTHTTEDVWPEPGVASDEPTVASAPQADAPTSEYPTFSGEETSPPFADAGPDEDDQDEWPVRAPAKGIRLGIPAALMLAVVLVAAGFWGGAVVQKSHSTASGGAAAAGFAARLRNAAGGQTRTTTTGANGGLQFPGGGSGASGSNGTNGTISVVDGDTLYILTATNQLVKVKINASTTVTRNAKAAADELRPGDTVVVQGASGTGGTVQASSVAATAKGVSSTAGAFGGFASDGTGGGQGTPSG